MLKRSSVNIARERIRALVTSDRMNCTPEAYERICTEQHEVLSKYIEFTEDNFCVQITRTYLHIDFMGEED